MCSAGEPLNPEAIRWFREQYGLTVLDYYGLTESYPLCANYPFMEVREGSMGKPMPGWDVQILDENEQPLPRGESGEICLRARSNPHYPLGYWNNEEAAQETFGGDWFHTKDAARFDEDGYVWYEGRADDVIISAGYRIGPFEVESACLEHAAVKEAAAIAVAGRAARQRSSRRSSCSPRATTGSDELVNEIQAHVRSRLSAYAYPRKIEFVDDLPKTLTGKIRRIELRQREAGVDARRPDRTGLAAGETGHPRADAAVGGAARSRSPRWRRSARWSGSGWSAGSAPAGRCCGWRSRCAAAAGVLVASRLRRRPCARVRAGRGRGGGAVRRLLALRRRARAAASRATGTSWRPASGAGCRRSGPCGCRTSAPTRGRGSCSSCSAPSC